MKMNISASALLLLLLSLVIPSCHDNATPPDKRASARLEQGFACPPDEAKPRVWWHWMNGNITKDGALKDIEWMRRAGIGGFHCFDAGLTTPQIVEHRVEYMSDEWKDIFSTVISKADEYGMEAAVAGSPGWSETGGPWVKPEQAMKKLVWSEVDVVSGSVFDGFLPHPPTVNGKFQDLSDPSAWQESELYSDIAVVAIRTNGPSVEYLSPEVTSSGGEFSLGLLTDGCFSKTSRLPYPLTGEDAWIEYEFEAPQTICGADIAGGIRDDFVERVMLQGDEGTVLECSDDGVIYRPVASVTDKAFNIATLSFEPVTAKFFRLRFKPEEEALRGYYAPALPHKIAMRPAGASGISVAEFRLYSIPRVARYIEKAGYLPASGLYCDDYPSCDSSCPASEVVDLTGKMSADGHLEWSHGGGCWKILRFGCTLTGHQNCPASPEATGLEVDKLDPVAVRDYITHYIDMYKDASGGLMGEKGIHFIMFDSWEAGCQNWTPEMFEAFKAECGYDMRPWLPAIAGYAIGSREESDKFLWDFRKTIGELIARNHYDNLAGIVKEYGLENYCESQEFVRAFIADGMRVKKNASIPMCAMWTADYDDILAIGASGADCRESASVAHLYGQKLVSAEALTTADNAWSSYPEALKERADLLMANGLNRFIIHESAHQPVDDFKPGFTLGSFGQWFNRHETWAEQAGAWMQYLSRSCYLLQQGRTKADILYYYGEDNNLTMLYGFSLPAIPEGWNFDFVNADAIVNDLRVKGGRIIAPSGNEYKVLALGENARMMSLPVLRALSELVRRGAVIVGEKPLATPSLSDDVGEFRKLADAMWEDGAYGRGKVLSGTIREALDYAGCVEDVIVSKPSPDSRYLFQHRIADGIHICWLDSRTKNVEDVEASFNIAGLEPEIWNAVDGSIRPASYHTENGRTVVNLHFEPEDALFVVFRRKALADAAVLPTISSSKSPVDGPWNVSFLNGMGAPESVVFEELKDWTSSGDAAIRYYSGTALYSKTFQVDGSQIGDETWLDLGSVKQIAEVRLNGEDVGIVWKTPWKVNVSSAVREGENHLEIKVVNLWRNRLIGDERGDAGRYGRCAAQHHQADEELTPSGLLGPVSIETVRRR